MHQQVSQGLYFQGSQFSLSSACEKLAPTSSLHRGNNEALTSLRNGWVLGGRESGGARGEERGELGIGM